MWKAAPWKGVEATMIRHKTPGDGSCLIHSILYSISEVYRALQPSKRSKLTRKIRDEMADKIKDYWDKIINKDLKNIVDKAIEQGTEDELGLDIVSQYSIDNVIKELKCDSYLNETLVIYLSLLFNINIIVYSFKDKMQYYLGTKNIIDPQKQSTVIISYGSDHFETIGQKLDDDHVLLIFSNNHPTIKQIVSIYTNSYNDEY